MDTFQQFLARMNEDIPQSFDFMRQQQRTGEKQPASPAVRAGRRAVLQGGKFLANVATGGILGNLISVGEILSEFAKKMTPDNTVIEGLREEFGGMEIPADLLDISPKILGLMSLNAFATVMRQTLTQIKGMEEYPPNIKGLFNYNARVHLLTSLGLKVKGHTPPPA